MAKDGQPRVDVSNLSFTLVHRLFRPAEYREDLTTLAAESFNLCT